MAEKTQLKTGATAADQLREEYERQSALFDAQPTIVQRFLEAQASQIANAYIERQHNLHFSLPDRVTLSKSSEPLPVPRQHANNGSENLATLSLGGMSMRHYANVLRNWTKSSDKAVAASAELVRFAAANNMVRNMLPAGRRVTYLPADDDDIPSIPSRGLQRRPGIGHHRQYRCHCRGRPGR